METSTRKPASPQRRLLATTAAMGTVFCLALIGTMLFLHFTATTNDPWKSPQLLERKERLVAEPRNEQLKQEIRELDLDFRRKFRHRIALDNSGGWLLVGGALLLVVAARKAAELSQRLPLPQPARDSERIQRAQATQARRSVTATALVVAAGLLVVGLTIHSALPTGPGGAQLASANGGTNQIAAADIPSLDEFRANWPRFRGWDGGGYGTRAIENLLPDEKGAGAIIWKVAIPAPGHSSPVVWGNRVFISGGTAAKREVFCYDAQTGNLLWRRAIENVPGSSPPVSEVPEDTGYAASTMATDGRRAFVMFANGDLAAVTFDGAVNWSKFLGPIKNAFGHASSLAVWPGRLIVQLDQGEEPSAASKLMALDGATGRVLWERPRPVGSSWATPVVVEAAGKTQIVTCATPWVIGYSLTDGAELWRAELLSGEVVSSPLAAGGRLLVVDPSSRLLALRPDGAGDVTKSHVAWTAEDNVPDIAGPVSDGELVFTVGGGGTLTCFDLKDGKKIWEQNLQLEVQSSPAILGNRLLLVGVKGVAVVVEAARQFKELQRADLKDKFLASPALANGRVYLRGETNLFCLGPAEVKATKEP